MINQILFRVFFLIAIATMWAGLADATVADQLPGTTATHQSSKFFAVPPGLEGKVNFWKKVYAQYTTSEVIIHDADNMEYIYEILNIKGLSPSTREQLVKRAKNKYAQMLRKLAHADDRSLSAEEKRIKLMVKRDFAAASQRVRGQLGQADRFRDGLERSGRYQGELNRVFREYGLPLELTALPHVESSFQIGAYSKVGAAGIWQFTHSTGRLFMKINYEMDERRDPFISTVAAARLLKKNFETVGSWPLAVTAYNHGLNGMKRAKDKYGDDIVRIINNYKSPAFGFASQNFYAEFLAALHVSQNEERYFPGLKKEPPLAFHSIPLNYYYGFKYLADHYGISRERLAELNPALRPIVISGEKRVPKGYHLKIPATGARTTAASLSTVPDKEKHDSQKPSKWYKVERGDTLSHIARRFNTSVSLLCQLNHIQSSRRVYIGQTLRLPHGSEIAATQVAKVAGSNAGASTSEATASSAPVVVRNETQPEKIAEPQATSIQDRIVESYLVRKNDNLNKIAQRTGVKTSEILRLNGLKQDSVIHPGQVLKMRELASDPENPSSTTAETNFAPAENIITTSEDALAASEKTISQVFALSDVEILKNHEKAVLGAVTVETNETLGHYSEWAELSLSEIRKTNRLRYNRALKVGDRIKLLFSKVPPEKFNERRREYHDSIQEDFYTNYEIIRTEVITVKPGQSLWTLCREIYEIPYWLLKAYNPEVDLAKLMPGKSLTIPIVGSRDKKNPTAT